MITCTHGIKDAIYLLDRLLPTNETGTYTVASLTSDPTLFDFASLVEALEWSKVVGANIHSTTGIELILADGVHPLTQTDILKKGLISFGRKDDATMFFMNVNISIKGSTTLASVIEVDSPVEDIVFINSRVLVEDVEIKILGTNPGNLIRFIGVNSSINFLTVVFNDTAVSLNEKSSSVMSDIVVVNNNNVNKDMITASHGSSFTISNIDLTDGDFNISASRAGEIMITNMSGNANTVLTPAMNTMSLDRSIIFDGTIAVNP